MAEEIYIKKVDVVNGVETVIFERLVDNQDLLQSSLGWTVPQLNLGDGATSGVSLFRAGAGGIQYSFDGSSNDEWSCNKEFFHNNVAYDGSDIRITLYYQLSSNATSGDTLKWETQYDILSDGDDSDGAGTTFTETETITGKVTGQVYKYAFTTNLTGTALKEFLQLSMKRKAFGAGADTYTGSVWLVDIKLEKV